MRSPQAEMMHCPRCGAEPWAGVSFAHHKTTIDETGIYWRCSCGWREAVDRGDVTRWCYAYALKVAMKGISEMAQEIKSIVSKLSDTQVQALERVSTHHGAGRPMPTGSECSKATARVLERHGCVLFDEQAGRVALTRLGQAVADHCAALGSFANPAEREIGRDVSRGYETEDGRGIYVGSSPHAQGLQIYERTVGGSYVTLASLTNRVRAAAVIEWLNLIAEGKARGT